MRARLAEPSSVFAAAGVGTFELARFTGTSVEMIERAYGHLVAGADESFRTYSRRSRHEMA
jgi:hypothetical protein